jgi:hypothetical protein
VGRIEQSREDTDEGRGKEKGKVIPGKGMVKLRLSLILTKHHATKTFWVSGGIAPPIL